MKFQVGETRDGAPIYEDLYGRVTYGCAMVPIAEDGCVSRPEPSTDTA